MHRRFWDVAGKGGKRASRGAYSRGTCKRRESSILKPAASAVGAAGLCPAGADGGQKRRRGYFT